MGGKVICVIVTYNPDLNVLGQLLDRTTPQVHSIVLVDNGDGINVGQWLSLRNSTDVTLLPLGENRGIAQAQNVGIHWARERGADQVLIFDHDSEPPIDLVPRLQDALATLERRGEKIAAVGPRYINSKWRRYITPSPFAKFRYGFISQCFPDGNSPYVPVDFLIASGSLIPIKAFDAIGTMSEELFIDYVDIEWGLRARQAGWSLYGIWDIVMEHSLGDDVVVVFGHIFPVHGHIRHYYVMRNAVWLCRGSKLIRKWKIGIAYNAFRRFIAYSLLMPQPIKHFRFMCLGLWDGARGKMGKL